MSPLDVSPLAFGRILSWRCRFPLGGPHPNCVGFLLARVQAAANGVFGKLSSKGGSVVVFWHCVSTSMGFQMSSVTIRTSFLLMHAFLVVRRKLTHGRPWLVGQFCHYGIHFSGIEESTDLNLFIFFLSSSYFTFSFPPPSLYSLSAFSSKSLRWFLVSSFRGDCGGLGARCRSIILFIGKSLFSSLLVCVLPFHWIGYFVV